MANSENLKNGDGDGALEDDLQVLRHAALQSMKIEEIDSEEEQLRKQALQSIKKSSPAHINTWPGDDVRKYVCSQEGQDNLEVDSIHARLHNHRTEKIMVQTFIDTKQREEKIVRIVPGVRHHANNETSNGGGMIVHDSSSVHSSDLSFLSSDDDESNGINAENITDIAKRPQRKASSSEVGTNDLRKKLEERGLFRKRKDITSESVTSSVVPPQRKPVRRVGMGEERKTRVVVASGNRKNLKRKIEEEDDDDCIDLNTSSSEEEGVLPDTPPRPQRKLSTHVVTIRSTASSARNRRVTPRATTAVAPGYSSDDDDDEEEEEPCTTSKRDIKSRIVVTRGTPNDESDDDDEDDDVTSDSSNSVMSGDDDDVDDGRIVHRYSRLRSSVVLQPSQEQRRRRYTPSQAAPVRRKTVRVASISSSAVGGRTRGGGSSNVKQRLGWTASSAPKPGSRQISIGGGRHARRRSPVTNRLGEPVTADRQQQQPSSARRHGDRDLDEKIRKLKMQNEMIRRRKKLLEKEMEELSS